MRVAINGKYAATTQTGSQRYCTEIVSRLLRSSPERYALLTPPWVRSAAAATGLLRRITRFANSAWEQAWLPVAARGFDLLYCPGNSMPLRAERAVVVIHDVIPLTNPEWFSRSYASWAARMIPAAVQRAIAVVTVSNTARANLEAMFPHLAGRVAVVPNGVGSHFRPRRRDEIAATLARLGIAGRYVLTVGTLDPRKNLPRVLEAWSRIAGQLPDHELVVVGMTSDLFANSEHAARTLKDSPRVRWLGFVPDDDLAMLYAGAGMLVYASLDEGFGIPPLEAMACHTPVVVSRAGALPEVCADAAHYVEPRDLHSIAAGMLRVATDSAFAAELVTRGERRAAFYSWDAAAAATEDILQRAIEPQTRTNTWRVRS